MATRAVEVQGLRANNVKCPDPACGRTFACDACLHAHLLRRHNVRYGEVFGPTHEAWLSFCEQHADVSPTMLGL